jgi:predicted transposase YdaD
MGKADISSKYILAGEPVEWVRWLLQDATAQVEERLSGEFQFILRRSDELFRVRGQQGPFVLVLEVQLHIDSRMPRRMRAYAALAEEKYDLPVYPVVFYLLPPAVGVTLPGFYHSQFMGLTAHQDFRVVAVWEIEARQVLEEGIVALAPFVPLMKGADGGTIRDGVRLLREREVGEEAEVALALFASFVMEAEQIRQIVRWDMAVLRESPWYNQILEEGLQQGLQQGQMEGTVRTQRENILQVLRARFGLSRRKEKPLADQLETIDDLDDLRDLFSHALLDVTLTDFSTQLERVADGR